MTGKQLMDALASRTPEELEVEVVIAEGSVFRSIDQIVIAEFYGDTYLLVRTT